MATEIRELVREGAAKLARIADSPQLEAELLLARSLEVPRSALHARANEPVLDCDATDRYEALLTRRTFASSPLANSRTSASAFSRSDTWILRSSMCFSA